MSFDDDTTEAHERRIGRCREQSCRARIVWLENPRTGKSVPCDADTVEPDDTEFDDERHIAPLQLEVIRRGVELWTNPGDTVLSPFAGIGSEGYVALELGRKFIGVELKRSYFDQACANLASADAQSDMFKATAS